LRRKKALAESWVSRSEAETKKIGALFARRLRAGDVVALYGELGAGKTTLVKGIARGLGVKSGTQVLSPTFVVIHEYAGRLNVHHLDWYRLKKVEGVDEALALECFDSQGVVLVEWPQRGEKLLPENTIRIKICHKGPTTRLMEVFSR
jgi:tRNA threonylcarbamoyl adenosine modification protein YjeE